MIDATEDHPQLHHVPMLLEVSLTAGLSSQSERNTPGIVLTIFPAARSSAIASSIAKVLGFLPAAERDGNGPLLESWMSSACFSLSGWRDVPLTGWPIRVNDDFSDTVELARCLPESVSFPFWPRSSHASRPGAIFQFVLCVGQY